MNYETKAQATKAARHARALLNKPKGWKSYVFENLGWHYTLRNGPLTLHPSCNGMFFSLLSDDIQDHIGGASQWTSRFSHVNPNKVVQDHSSTL